MAVTIWWKDFNLIFFLIAIQILQVTVNLWSKRSGFSVCWDLSKECTKLRNYRYVTTFLSLVRTRRLLVTHELCVRISESVGLKTLWCLFICTHAVFRVSLCRVVYFAANTGFSVKRTAGRLERVSDCRTVWMNRRPALHHSSSSCWICCN